MNKIKILLIAISVVALGVFLFNCITVVETGEIGLKVRLGQVVGEPLQAGIHGKIPVIESVKIFDAKVQKEEVATNSASKDLQDVSMTVAVNYSINALNVKELYSNVGMNYKATILQPSINEALKAVTS
jgi:regulator of protease activity HflC (stomatin/prohibitin superfamily)